MRSLREFLYLARDFWRFQTGNDYFRQPQGLGMYFQDKRCYYNDLRGKALWNGAFVENVPALFVPSSRTNIVSPCMVLLWGLGNLDRFFLEKDPVFAQHVQHAVSWLLAHVLPEGYWHSDIIRSDPGHYYYSNNSAMNQGLALSFLTRVVENQLVDASQEKQVLALMQKVFLNMLAPIQEGGTTLLRGNDLFLCEFSRKDGNVVLNGWIFAWFGLFDYVTFSHNPTAEKISNQTVETMQLWLPKFQLPNGWSYYDSSGRCCSPHYHYLHINLLDAMYRITGITDFRENMRILQKANTLLNRLRYTFKKIMDKMFRDSEAYSSQA